ncbi:ectonucleoside triphosphate diphosphohydrolase 8 [Aplochiton taeniatus]
MRLLELQNSTQSEQVLEQVRKAIQRYPFIFRGARILTGIEEGVYGWITINYIQEGLIKHSFEGEWVHPKGVKISGALDMGGSSTQIAFTPRDAVQDPSTAAALQLYGYKYEVYTHSYLCFGKDQAMTKLQAHLLEKSGFLSSVHHPCYHLGYNLTLTMGELYASPCVTKPAGFDPIRKFTFTGSGDSQMCLSEVKSIINLTNCSFAPNCGFDGVYQPPVNGDFFAFSAYYYTFSFLGLTPKSSLTQTITSIDTFCRRTWDSLKLEYSTVKEKFLRDYCASGHYIRAVLQEGYKFNQGNWENIYFQRQVAGIDVGWTLGYMLNQTNMIPPDRPLVVTGVHQGQWVAEVFFIAFAISLILTVLSVLLVWSPGK